MLRIVDTVALPDGMFLSAYIGTNDRIFARLRNADGSWSAPTSGGQGTDLDLGTPPSGRPTTAPWLTVNKDGTVLVQVLGIAQVPEGHILRDGWQPWLRVYRHTSAGAFKDRFSPWSPDGPSYTRAVPRDPALP